jgi:NADPH-dependent curcumin reductase CurA
MTQTSRRILFVRRPQGAPVPDDFRLEEAPVPTPKQGEALVRTVWLSLDPYMRGRMNEGPSYTPGVAIGSVMVGETVGEVLESRSPSLQPGDFVRGFGGWQSHVALPAEKLTKVDPEAAPISTALGVLGMPGFTAYAGLLEIGEPKPGETVVIGAASGAVGAIAGQIARIKGCRVVGVAGGPEKCRYVVDELGFDACLDRRQSALDAGLKAACPNGVDIYVELVGGAVTDAVLPLLNTFARIPVIGGIAHYNATSLPDGPDRLPWLMRQVLTKRLRIRGMIVWDFASIEPDFRRDMTDWVRQGLVRYREDVTEGLENAPEALIGMLEGRNFGKKLVRVGPDSEGARHDSRH